MMTTMAAMMGTLPIALGLGAGGDVRRPLGLAVVGGLVISQIVTLYITPIIYLYLERLQQRLGRKSACFANGRRCATLSSSTCFCRIALLLGLRSLVAITTSVRMLSKTFKKWPQVAGAPLESLLSRTLKMAKRTSCLSLRAPGSTWSSRGRNRYWRS